MIAYQVNIFSIFVHWLKKNFIIVPSILFLTTPFLLPYLIKQISVPSSKLILTPLDRALTIFVTAASIFIGNRYLDGFRKQQEQKKVAKLLISSIEGHLESLNKMLSRFQGGISQLDTVFFYREFNDIKNDYIYETATKQVGAFELQEVDFIAQYSKNLNSIIRDILTIYNEKEVISKSSLRTYDITPKEAMKLNLGKLAIKKAESLVIDAPLLIMILSKKINQDIDKFNKYKELAKNNYARTRIKGDNRGFNQDMIDSLTKVEQIFEEFGLCAELEDTYNQKKIELKNE